MTQRKRSVLDSQTLEPIESISPTEGTLDSNMSGTSAVHVSSAAQLRNIPFSELPERVHQSQVRVPPAPMANSAEIDVDSTNPRVARALGRNERPLPPLPVGELTEQSVCLWLDKVVSGMHPDSEYRKELLKVLKRFGDPDRKAAI